MTSSGAPSALRELEEPVEVAVAGLRLDAEHFLADVLDHALGHLVRDAPEPDREEPAGVVRDAVVVLACPADQFFLGGLTLHDPLDPACLVERAARRDQLGTHLVYECLTIERHRRTPS